MTMTTTEREPRYVVLVRPRGVGPDWWPSVPAEMFYDRANPGVAAGRFVEFAWKTVTVGGGHTQGFDPNHAVSGGDELTQLVDDWFDEHAELPWPWELCQVRLSD
jgi:hypothetical protein